MDAPSCTDSVALASFMARIGSERNNGNWKAVNILT